MINLSDLTEQLKELTDALSAELAKFQVTNTKASAKRVRAQTIALAKVAKEFRALSVKM